MSKKCEVFIIRHSNVGRKGCSEKLSEAELKKITSNLDKAGINWIYLPPGIGHTTTTNCCEEDEDDYC